LFSFNSVTEEIIIKLISLKITDSQDVFDSIKMKHCGLTFLEKLSESEDRTKCLIITNTNSKYDNYNDILDFLIRLAKNTFLA